MAFTKIVPAGINTGGSYTLQDLNVVGVLTASSFSGPLTGDATGLTGTPDVTVGAITAASADFSGNVSIAGTLTYEDVTNVDSVGLITARDGIIVTGGNVGIGTDNAGSNTLAVHGTTLLGKVTTDDAISKAEMVSKAALRIRPHVTNSGALNFAQVNNGSSIGVQYTNGSGTADWDIALQPYGGSVGIGTTDPTSLLHLYGNGPQLNAQGITGESQIRISSTGGNYRRIIFFDSAETPTKNNFQIAQQEVDNSLHIGPSTAVGGLTFSNTTGLVVDSVGSVGIGTDEPGQKLDIDGNIRLRAGNTTTYATTLKSILSATHTSSLTSNVNNATEFELIGSYADSGGSNPRVVLAAGGQKVGIGTDNPYARNHIEINAAAGAGSGSAGALWLKNADQTANNSATIFFGNNLNQASGAINLIHKDYSTNAGDITFDTRADGSTYAERVRITSTGSFAVGTTSDGNARFSFYNSGSNGSDATNLDSMGLVVRNDSGPTNVDLTGTDNFTIKVHNGAYAGSGVADPQGTISKILFNGNTHNGWNSYGAICLDTQGTSSGKGDLVFLNGGTTTDLNERIRIKSNGVVQIGNTAFGSDNGSRVLELLGTEGSAALFIGNNAVSGNGTCDISFAPSNKITGAQIICHALEDFTTGANRTADLAFVTRKDGTLSEKVRIKNNGKVGINDTNPDQILFVKNDEQYDRNSYASASTGGSQTRPPGTIRWSNPMTVDTGGSRGYRAWVQSGDAYPSASTYFDLLVRNSGFYRLTVKRSHSSTEAAVAQILIYGLANNQNNNHPVVHISGISGAGSGTGTAQSGHGFGSGNAVASFYWTVVSYNVNTYDTIIRIHTNGSNNQGIFALIEEI